MAAQPFFSLVVPTIARVHELRALLESMKRSQDRDFEVLIIDQNGDDRLDQVVDAYSALLPIKHVKVSFCGAARARNYGARLAGGRIINFPDDDAELTPDLLTQARAALSSGRVKVMAGASVDRAGRGSTTRFAEDEREIGPWNMWGRFIEFTLFMDRETFIAANGFDEEFGVGSKYGSDEAAELLIRLFHGRLVKPGEARYSFKLKFYHPEKARDFTEAGSGRVFNYARGSGALLAKWFTPPVLAYSLRMSMRTIAAVLVFRGAARRYYLNRLRGFWHGFVEYRAARVSGSDG